MSDEVKTDEESKVQVSTESAVEKTEGTENSEAGSEEQAASSKDGKTKRKGNLTNEYLCIAAVVIIVMLLPTINAKLESQGWTHSDSVLLDSIAPQQTCEILSYASLDSITEVNSLLWRDEDPQWAIAVRWSGFMSKGEGVILVNELPEYGKEIHLFFTADYKKVKGYKYVSY